MTGRGKVAALFRFLAPAIASVFLISCAPTPQQPLSRLDTPEHHTFTGVRLLDQEKFSAAGYEFERALKMDPRYSRAHTGAGLVNAFRGDFKGAFESLRQAEENARSDEEKLFVLVGYIRVNTISHAECLRIETSCRSDDAWVKYSEDAFAQAVRIDPNAALPYYYMGECYLTALELEKAGRLFSRVLDMNAEHIGEADRRWKQVQKIRRAMPATVKGKKIALAERITRADAAALFMEELGIDALYVWRTGGFAWASRDQKSARTAVPRSVTATDIADHPLRADIEGILRIGIRGLSLYPGGAFRPDEQVDRASFAMMIEDILGKVTGDGALSTRFIGSPSPFFDLQDDLPYFNAVLVVTSRGIMEAKDSVTGEFAPHQPVGGADALLAIRKLRDQLRY